jgi:hypothetical protein
LDKTPKAQETKANLNELGCSKLKVFCMLEIINRMEKQLRDWETVFSGCMLWFGYEMSS